MPDFRELIEQRLQELDKTWYWLANHELWARRLGKTPKPENLYRFKRGDTTIRSDRLEIVLEILELEVVAKD